MMKAALLVMIAHNKEIDTYAHLSRQQADGFLFDQNLLEFLFQIYILY